MQVGLGYRLIFTASQESTREQRKSLTQAERRLLMVGCEAFKRNHRQFFAINKKSTKRLILKLEASPLRKNSTSCKICKYIVSFFKAIGNFLHLRIGTKRLNETIKLTRLSTFGFPLHTLYDQMYAHVIKNKKDFVPHIHKILKGIIRFSFIGKENNKISANIKELIRHNYEIAKKNNELKKFFTQDFFIKDLSSNALLASLENYQNKNGINDEIEAPEEIVDPNDLIENELDDQGYIQKDELIWINYATFVEDQKDALKNAKFTQKKAQFKNYFKDHIAGQQKCFDPIKKRVVEVTLNDELNWMNHLEALGVFDAQDENEVEIEPMRQQLLIDKNIFQGMPKMDAKGWNFQDLNFRELINNFNPVDKVEQEVDNGNTVFPFALKREMLQAIKSQGVKVGLTIVIEETIQSFYKLAGKAQEVNKLMQNNYEGVSVAKHEIGLLVHPEQHGQKDYVILGAPRILVNAYNKAKQNNDLPKFFNEYFSGGCTEYRTQRLQEYLSAEELSNNIATNPPLIPLFDKKKKKLDYIYEALEVFKDWTARDIAKEHQIKIDLKWVEAQKVEDSTKYKIINDAQYKFDERCNSKTFIEFLKNQAKIIGKEAKEGAFDDSDIQACVKQLIDNYDIEE